MRTIAAQQAQQPSAVESSMVSRHAESPISHASSVGARFSFALMKAIMKSLRPQEPEPELEPEPVTEQLIEQRLAKLASPVGENFD